MVTQKGKAGSLLHIICKINLKCAFLLALMPCRQGLPKPCHNPVTSYVLLRCSRFTGTGTLYIVLDVAQLPRHSAIKIILLWIDIRFYLYPYIYFTHVLFQLLYINIFTLQWCSLDALIPIIQMSKLRFFAWPTNCSRATLLASVQPEIKIRMSSFWPQDLNHCALLPSDSSSIQVRHCCFYLKYHWTRVKERSIFLSLMWKFKENFFLRRICQVSCLIVRLEAGTLGCGKDAPRSPPSPSSSVLPATQWKARLQQRIHGWIWPQSLTHPFGFPGTRKSLCDGIAPVTKLDLPRLGVSAGFSLPTDDLFHGELESHIFSMATHHGHKDHRRLRVTWALPKRISLVTGKAQAEAWCGMMGEETQVLVPPLSLVVNISIDRSHSLMFTVA